MGHKTRGSSATNGTGQIVVSVSADAEWAAAKQLLEPSCLQQGPDGEWFVASLAQTSVVAHGGWGKIAASASTEHLIARWQPRVFVNLGTCGGIANQVRVGDRLLITRTVAYDIEETMGDPQAAIAWYSTDIDLSWLKDGRPFAAHRSTIASADRDLRPEEAERLTNTYGAVAADWESAAIAWVAKLRGVPLLILRVVSDVFDGERGTAEIAGNVRYFTSALNR